MVEAILQTSLPLGQFVDALPCGAALIDPSGSVIRANKRLRAMLGRDGQDLSGAPAESFCVPGDAPRLRDLIADAGVFREADATLLLPDGAGRPVLVSARVLDGAVANHDGVVLATFTDVTRQLEVEQALREQYQAVAIVSDRVLGRAMELNHQAELLERRVRERTAELNDAHMEAVYMLAIAAEAKDEDTGQHVRRLERYSGAIARQMGVGIAEAKGLGYAAVLHDVGKIHVPDHILKKPGALTDDERAAMQQHTTAGERILSPSPFFAVAAAVARHHHENWDGSGYPDGLHGDRIPLEARIVHVADVFDALTSARVYKDAWSERDAVAMIVEDGGKMFDPAVVAAFEAAYASGRWPQARGTDR